MRFAVPPDDVLARLAALREHDAPTHGGHVLSYVYDAGEPELDELAAAAIRAMQPVNGLDPTTFGSVAALERDLVAFTRDLLGGDDGGEPVVGTVTSGGTESCLLAVEAARDAWLAARGAVPGSARPRLVAPVTVHAAFQKAAHYFGLELDLVPVRSGGAVAAEVVAERLGDRPEDVALVVVSAPSYPHAALDPVAEVAATAAARGVPVHVDACIGGMALPFWPGLPPWDLRVPGVTSLSVDLHKYGYAPKGVSMLLHRGRDRQRGQYFATTRWPGYPVVSPTLLGSRSGGPLAAAWAIVQALGRDGFAELAGRARQATHALRAAVGQIDGLRVVGEPAGPLFAVATDESVPTARRVDPHVWADAVATHGWVLQPQPAYRQADGTVLPHTTHLTVTPVTARVLDELVPALGAAADAVRGTPRPEASPLVDTGSATVPDSDPAVGLLRGLGLDTSRIGENGAGLGPMAPLLAAVEALPAPVAERLLVELLARLVEPR